VSGNGNTETVTFARKPENDFAHYIHTYYERCRSRCECIEAIAGKWMFRDLIPGMSDFDTRFIVREGMTADDWCKMSLTIGEAHLALCQAHSCWARNLEHLPGINLSWSELVSQRTYYPEFHQWSFYHSVNPAKVNSAIDWLTQRSWDVKDEYFHLKKFCLLYGRYNRSIDPPINLGIHQNKYPLHSRLMHYFTPAVQSAACLLERRNICGKFDALEIVKGLFPTLGCWCVVEEIFHSNYESPKWYREPFLSELDNCLEVALRIIAVKLRNRLTLIPAQIGDDVDAWKQALQDVTIDPAVVIFENTRFSRLMKGRFLFYAKAPKHFDTSWLIENELKRIGRSFFGIPFTMYWKIKTGESITNPISIVDALGGDLLTSAEIRAVKEFARLTPGHKFWQDGEEKDIALAITDVFDDFFKALTKLSEAVYATETE